MIDLESLVRSAQGGDTMAMSRLLDELTPYVRRVCGPIALADGQDAAQDTLIAVFKYLRTLREPAAIMSWVRAIAVREAVRTAKRNSVTIPVEQMDVLAVLDSAEMAADIQDLLGRLSAEHRAILTLRYVDGLTEDEAGKLLELPQGTVKSRLSRAREHFREAWSS